EASETALVRAHVASCADCARELGAYAAQAARLRDAGGRSAPRTSGVDLWDGIQERLARPEPARRGLLIRFAAPLAAAAALVVSVGTWWAVSPSAWGGFASPAPPGSQQPLTPQAEITRPIVKAPRVRPHVPVIVVSESGGDAIP